VVLVHPLHLAVRISSIGQLLFPHSPINPSYIEDPSQTYRRISASMLLKGLNIILMFGSVLLVMFLYLGAEYLRSRMRIARNNAKSVAKVSSIIADPTVGPDESRP